MELIERQILRSLQRHGELSQTGLYRYFHRYRAHRKNAAVDNLVAAGFIHKEVKLSSDKARKPTQYFKLSELGMVYLQNEPQFISRRPKPKRKSSKSNFF